MKICVLQLARLGDILQSLPAIDALKAENPNCEITLIVRERFANAAKLSRNIDNIIVMPTQAILEDIIEDTNMINFDRGVEMLAQFVQQINHAGPYDRVVNLTFSSVSSWLAALINSKDYRGVYRAKDGAYQIDDSWSQYFFAQVLQKNINVIHLNDLFSFIAGCTHATWPVALPQPKDPINLSQKNPEKVRIGVQTSASQKQKAPSAEAWRIILKTIERDCQPEYVFFGSAEEKDYINGIIEDAQLATAWNMAGACAFHETIDSVRTCDVVITPDTAMVHMASLVAGEKRANGETLKVVYFPLGGVRAEETGPYGEGHHLLYAHGGTIESFARACSQAVQFDTVKERIPHSVTKFLTRSNGTGINLCVPENFDHDENTNFFEKSFYLLSEFRCEGRIEEIEIPRVGSPHQPQSLDDFVKHHELLLNLKKTADFGSHFCFQMLEQISNAEELKKISQSLSDTDVLIEQVAQTDWLVKPLVDWWKVAKASVVDNKFESLITKTEATYRILSQNVDILLQLMETAVKAAHERVTSTANVQQTIVKEMDV